jgi:hypothetical protein
VSPPFPTPAENLATILQWLGRAVASQGILGRLAAPILGLILGRFRTIGQDFARLAGQLRDGTYRPRRYAPRRPPAVPRPRRRSELPRTFGWLLPLVPEAVQYRAQLDHLLRDPEMAALLEAAPAPMARVLRPLCWALRLTPPPLLARPRRAAPPATALAPSPAALPRAVRPRPTPIRPDPPARRRPSPKPPRRTHGPPHPA